MLANWIDNLNDTGRKVLFGVVVVVLVVVAWLASTEGPESTTAPSPTETGTSTVVPNPTSSVTDPAADESDDPVAAGAVTIDVESPVTQDEVKALARKAATFAAVYQSFRFDDDPAAKVSAVRKYLSRDSQVAPELAVPSGAALTAIRSEKSTVTVTPKHVEVTLIAQNTVAFVVDATVTTSRGTDSDNQSRAYSVTFYRDSVGWGVGSFTFDSDIAE